MYRVSVRSLPGIVLRKKSKEPSIATKLTRQCAMMTKKDTGILGATLTQ